MPLLQSRAVFRALFEREKSVFNDVCREYLSRKLCQTTTKVAFTNSADISRDVELCPGPRVRCVRNAFEETQIKLFVQFVVKFFLRDA